MSIIQGNTKVSAGGYTIDQSIRFNDDDSAYLNRTPGSASDRKKWTWSGWLKRGALTTTNQAGIFSATSGLNQHVIVFNDSNGGKNTLEMYLRNSGGALGRIYTSAVFRDPSAWYHCVFVFDSANATAADRMIIYVNGARQTVTTATTLTQNTDGWINYTYQHDISRAFASNTYLYDGYMAEINFIDGQALAPTDFGEYNDDGVWIPKKYAGTYGTNGFYLKGQDSAALGDDSSGNSNDFTSSGLTSDDQRADTPTNNMMTFNPLNNMRDDGDPTDGNRVFYNTGGTRNICGTTFHFNTGKYVQAFSFDATGTSNWQIGSQPSDRTAVDKAPGSNEDLGEAPIISPFTTYYVGVGLVGTNNTGITADTADTIWVAMDLDSGKQWIGLYDNSAASMIWFDSSAGQTGDPAAGSNPVYTGTANRSYNFALCSRSSTKITLLEESEATGTVPTGFTYVGAVQDTYATPAIADGSAYFQQTLFTGTGSTLEVNQTGNSTFQPDFVWIKQRNKTDNHIAADIVNGSYNGYQHYVNNTNSAVQTTEGVTSFDADGFTLGPWNNVNQSGITAVAWQWLASNSTGSNTDGDITSTVSANTTSGFSVVGYTGNGSASQTIGHGLGVTPSIVIVFPVSNGDHKLVSNWETGVTAFTEKLKLNDTEAATSTGSTQIIGGSSTTFTVGTDPNVNGSGRTYVAFCWAEIAGYSRFGTYTGNGSTAGPFVWCGLRPAFVLVKRTNTADNWVIVDSSRNSYNVTNLRLYPDNTTGDITSTIHDFLSNGFKLRASDGGVNGSGSTYIFMAFAEHPFGGADVAPVPAR